jgi:23S rRNA (uracil1939-C5)-methyltransferase
LRCYVDGITHDGDGVSRIDGKATFIPYAIPGETVEIEISQTKKTWQKSVLKEIIVPSPYRVNPPCPHHYDCGGCSYQHIEYPHQLELKRQIVKDSLQRIGRIDASVDPVIGMDEPWHYRNKVTWHVIKESTQSKMGYFADNSRRLMDIDQCLLISHAMQQYSRIIKDHLTELRMPDSCEVTIRQSSVNQELMLLFNGVGASQIDFGRLLNYQEVASVFSFDREKIRLHYGEQYLAEKILDIIFEISPLSFFQINHPQTEKMVSLIKGWVELEPNDNILDAYCGIGSIALSVASQAGSIAGVEYNKSSVKDAKRCAYLNQIANCRFIKGACEEIIPSLDKYYDLVILDPPRAGCKKEVIDAVLKQNPRKIIYISCNPSTLARDLAFMVDDKYFVSKVQPIDMFPQTPHIETVVSLEKFK